MKICVISFDFWGYDAHIVKSLEKRGVEAYHIKIGAVSHDNFLERLKNTFSKVFLGKNLKHQKRQKFVIKTLEKLGHQDQILVLNPNTFDISTLEFIKTKTNRLITFLYDNLERFPVRDRLHLFDKIYSFDDKDIETHGFEPLTNYNYLEFSSKEEQKSEKDILYITSYDKKRVGQLKILSKKFTDLGLRFEIFVIGKRVWKEKLKSVFAPNDLIFSSKRIKPQELPNMYSKARIILDLMRENQFGLSFRVFEAMALEKKIITDNPKIRNYDFYNPNNILVLNEDFSNLDPEFFVTPYQSLPQEIYDKYTLDSWVRLVFNLQ